MQTLQATFCFWQVPMLDAGEHWHTETQVLMQAFKWL